ncbi:MAG: thiamine diphosphokinase [Eubacterium sp.]|nr:thiamine diphosphokinase [Eubacterium sp.]
MHVLVVSGGSIDCPFAKAYLSGKTFDRIIAADAGLAACAGLGINPTDVIGDFDSLEDFSLLEEVEKKGIPVTRYPVKKDYTDTDLAFSMCEEMGADRVTVLGATGSRMDHTLANLALMARMEKKGIHTVILDAHNEAEVLIGPAEKTFMKKEKSEYISVLALWGTVRGLDLEGFLYPMENGDLHPFESLGISNEITGPRGTVRIREGCLLVIRSAD